MARAVTMVDVAARAGVSTATVSLVLSGRPGRFSERTAARVTAAADELGYVVDAGARSLRTRRNSTIDFLSDAATVTRFASGMVQGILNAAQERGNLVLMVETGRDPRAMQRGFAAMQARRVDALVVGIVDSRHVELPTWTGPRPVVANGTAVGCHSILPDEAVTGRAAIDHLAAHGHRRIAFVGRHATPTPPEVSVNIPVRIAGIDQAMEQAGLEFSAVYCDIPWEPSIGRAGTHAVLDAAPDTTAVPAANDRIAFSVHQALAERGLAVGRDVSVMSFDDEQLASLVLPGLTSIRLPHAEMGAAAVELALDPVNHQDPDPLPVLLPMPLVERGSVHTI